LGNDPAQKPSIPSTFEEWIRTPPRSLLDNILRIIYTWLIMRLIIRILHHVPLLVLIIDQTFPQMDLPAFHLTLPRIQTKSVATWPPILDRECIGVIYPCHPLRVDVGPCAWLHFNLCTIPGGLNG